jgi:hypothetical protein
MSYIMKNITQLNSNTYCFRCNSNGFYIKTPNGGDYITCPSCSGHDFWSGIFYGNNQNKADYDKHINQRLEDYDKIEDNAEHFPNSHEYLYCYNCRIIYDYGCTHSEEGCTSSIYNGHVVGKWKYKDEIYIGMPQFDTFEEYISEINNIEILEMVCLRSKGDCENAHYKSDKYPEYYHKCELRKGDCECSEYLSKKPSVYNS